MNKNEIEFEDIISLDDGKEYIVVSNITYKERDYIYIAEIGNPDNSKYAEVENDNSQTYITIIGKNETELLNNIEPLFLKQTFFKEMNNN